METLDLALRLDALDLALLPALLFGAGGGGGDKQAAVDSHFGQVAESYQDLTGDGLLNRYRRWECRDLLADAAAAVPGRRVLEVGCGSGWYTRRIRDLGPRLLVATDRLPGMVANLPGEGLCRLACDACNLPFPDASFDCLVCAGVLEFLPAPAAFFAEAARLLAPGGRLLVLAPRRSVVGLLYRFFHGRHGIRLTFFGSRDLAALAQSSGLKLSRVGHAGLFALSAMLERPGTRS